MRICPDCNNETESEICPNDGRTTVDAAVFDRRSVDDYVGKTIASKFLIRELLGKGAFGSVYKAQHVDTGGDVAIKVLRGELADDPNVIKRFYVEAQNTHKLHHPNTVRLMDFGRWDDDVLYIAMEYVRGQTLSRVLADNQALPLKRCVRIITQVLKSLGEAHEHNLVHRDVKPDNIMLLDEYGEKDFVKVLDFGISKSVESTGSMTQGIVGTPYYMAPEQWLSLPPDNRTDLYAVGCLLYQMLTGQLPYVLKDGEGSLSGLMWAHVHGTPVPLEEHFTEGLPVGLSSVVMSLLSKSADERPRTALAVLNVLTELDLTQDYRLKRSPLAQEIMEGETLDSESVEVAATPVMRPADGGAETQTELVDSASELSLEGHGSPTRIWLAALLILAMLAVGLVIASMDKTSAVPATAATSRVDASLSARSVRKSVLDAPITKDAMVVVEPSAPSAPAALAPSDAAQSPRDMVGRTAEAEAIVVSWHVDSRPVGATVTIPAMKRALGQTPLRSNMSREVLKRLEMDGILTLEFKRFGFRTRSRVIRWKDVSDNRLAMTVQLKRRKKPRRSTPTTKPTPAPKKKKLLPALRTQ